ncbi:hypothetical protein ACFFWD_03495 [Bradyrhizobium erythrophlei]|uniref:hypothetical protein n=1 Tax=Bradyrhizobium erythrophlei TaxID=1437360 RepID=UPI0035E75AE3
MTISRLLQGSKLGPEEIERLKSAYRLALRRLCLVDRNDPIAEIVAREIIEIGATGVRDPAEISRIAVEQLGIGRPPSV